MHSNLQELPQAAINFCFLSMSLDNRILKIAFMNIHGQSKLPLVKQKQIEDFVKQNKIDILHLQEIKICDETFSS